MDETVEPQEQAAPERPEWLPEKFKSGEDMATSYKYLENKLGTAPKSYDISKADGWVSAEDDDFRAMLDLAKEKSVPQEVIDKMLDTTSRYAKNEENDFNKEMETLGENVDERLDVLKNWAKSNLTEDSFYALTGSIKTAEGIKALEELRGMSMDNTTVIPTGKESSSTAESITEITADMSNNMDKYKSDPKFRNEIRVRMEKAQTSGYVDKSSA